MEAEGGVLRPYTCAGLRAPELRRQGRRNLAQCQNIQRKERDERGGGESTGESALGTKVGRRPTNPFQAGEGEREGGKMDYLRRPSPPIWVASWTNEGGVMCFLSLGVCIEALYPEYLAMSRLTPRH
jgi:hypothetical protein